jgi:hypothetical protein
MLRKMKWYLMNYNCMLVLKQITLKMATLVNNTLVTIIQ